jgi:hypothetical protein
MRAFARSPEPAPVLLPFDGTGLQSLTDRTGWVYRLFACGSSLMPGIIRDSEESVWRVGAFILSEPSVDGAIAES